MLYAPCLALQLGVPLPTEGHYVTKGTVRHNKKGKVGISREAGNVTFSRSGLAQYLIEQARQKYPDQIQFHFDSPCLGGLSLPDLSCSSKAEKLQRHMFYSVILPAPCGG